MFSIVPSNVLRLGPLMQLLACAAAATASVGCATTGTTRWPSRAVDAASPALQGVRPTVLPVAHHFAYGDLLSTCTIGAPRVVAAKAAPPAGVEADASSSHVWLRYAEKASARVVMALDPTSLEMVAANDSLPSIIEEAKYMALSAWPHGAPASEERGLTSTDQAHRGQSAWDADSGKSRQSLPVVARVDSNRSLLAWTEGSIYGGMDVRVATVGSDGGPIGDPLVVPHDGSAIGQPALAVASSGHGVVAFIESNDHGFQLVAASLDCSSPATSDDTSVWASRGNP